MKAINISKTTSLGSAPPRSLISVVVPAHNVEAYIGRCLQSILGQTHHALEIVVVNDCSSDNTAKVLDSLAGMDERIRVLHLDRNVGVHAARCLGVRAARGGYLGFVDGDDWITPEMYSKLHTAAEEAGADIVLCGAAIASAPGQTHGAKIRFRRRALITEEPLKHFCQLNLGSGVLWNKLYRREAIETQASFPLERAVDFSEDYIVNFGAFADSSRVVLLPDCLYYYFQRRGSGSDAGGAGFSRTLRAYVVCLETYLKLSPQYAALIDLLYTRLLRFDCYRVNLQKELNPVSEELKESLQRLAAVHPMGVYSLIHAFDLTGSGEHQSRRPAARQFFHAAKCLCKAIARRTRNTAIS